MQPTLSEEDVAFLEDNTNLDRAAIEVRIH